MNLKTYQYNGGGIDNCLFGVNCKNKQEAKKYILNHGMLARVDYVLFKDKRYSINQVYKW